ncbi:MAG: MBL fold metallo-hydrolase [Planctomycetota bacterium]
MSIQTRVLGRPGRDNAVLVTLDSGQSVSRLLFDCGAGCLDSLGLSDLLSIDALFCSHLHMDHVAGFDSFFRANFDRVNRPNRIWGPPGTARILQHRFQGYWWNLHYDLDASWLVTDVYADRQETFRFELSEAFATAHSEGTTPAVGPLLSTPEFAVSAIQLEHNGPSLGYVVREAPRRNLDTSALADHGLRPGPWLQTLKDKPEILELEIDGEVRNLDELRRALLVERPGESAAYLTDFVLNESTIERVAKAIGGCHTLICEAQYADRDRELAVRNSHTTISSVAKLAARAEVKELVLFHLSDRYRLEDWREMLADCRETFSATSFPEAWEDLT